MSKKHILKRVVLIVLPMFAMGMLFISVTADQAQAHSLASENHRMVEHVSKIDCDQAVPELKQEKIELMKSHHGDDWQKHYQEIYGHDSGTYGKTRCRSPTVKK